MRKVMGTISRRRFRRMRGHRLSGNVIITIRWHFAGHAINFRIKSKFIMEFQCRRVALSSLCTQLVCVRPTLRWIRKQICFFSLSLLLLLFSFNSLGSVRSFASPLFSAIFRLITIFPHLFLNCITETSRIWNQRHQHRLWMMGIKWMIVHKSEIPN